MQTLLIVESPAKCKKIEKFLGKDYKCIASYGHITNLTKIDKNNNFEPSFKECGKKRKYIKNIRECIKKAKEVVLATDDDREGEAIAWHICNTFKLPITTTKRIIFNEITKNALIKAIANPTVIDIKKVHSQLGRQVLDQIVGFTISPILWKQFFQGGNKNGGLSAGRCQTPALRLIYENYQEIKDDKGEKVFETIGKFTDKNIIFKLNKEFSNESNINDFLQESVPFKYSLKNKSKVVEKIRPSPTPFSTSSLQQKASNELNFSPKRTMQIAQKLYEGGYITYMRTDNKRYSSEFISDAKKFILKKWSCGKEYLKKNYTNIQINKEKSKDTKTQEAHEAIRPTLLSTIDPDVDNGEKRLYKLIWTNTIESCMSDAIYNLLTTELTAPLEYSYKHNEEQIIFPGWLLVKGFIKTNDIYNYLYSLHKGNIECNEIYSKQVIKGMKTHYTESKLVKALEQHGIGRPSTFSSLVDKIQEKLYVKKEDIQGKSVECLEYLLKKGNLKKIVKNNVFGNEKNKLVLQPLGRVVCEFLIETFDTIFHYGYTDNMERELDKISQGIGDWRELCRSCNFDIGEKIKAIDNSKEKGIKIDENHTYIIGRYGPVIRCNMGGEITYKTVKKNLNIDNMLGNTLKLDDIIENEFTEQNLGNYQDLPVILKKGRYGLYINHNSKNYSLKGIEKDENEIVLEDVIGILSGKESLNPNIIKVLNENISIRKGKYGEYIFYKTKSMSKPRFFQMKKVFQNETDKKWKNHSTNYLIDLIRENCL